MTHNAQEYATLTEAAFEYVRDQLRDDSTIGIGVSPGGMMKIEIGSLLADDAEQHPELLPAVWIKPESDTITEHDMGDKILLSHDHVLEVSVFSHCQPNNSADLADAQAEHRINAGRVYDALTGLNEAGRAAGHWREFTPHGGTIRPVSLPLMNGAVLLVATISMRILRDKAWIT